MSAIDLIQIWEKYKYKAPLALALVGIVLIIGGLAINSSKSASTQPEFPKESLVAGQKIKVDVSGAVKQPGVYELDKELRVEGAIAAAGGISEEANQEYISKSLNLAQSLSDGMKIYIPFVGESAGGVSGAVAGSKTPAKVNINSGTQAELEALPGIGPVTAGKIISGRPYGKVEDLLDQKIVSKATFEKIKNLLTL